MKIDAKIELTGLAAETPEESFVKVQVDADYVESDPADVKDWCRRELETKLGRPVSDGDFEVSNMDEIVEELKFDEFERKTS